MTATVANDNTNNDNDTLIMANDNTHNDKTTNCG